MPNTKSAEKRKDKKKKISKTIPPNITGEKLTVEQLISDWGDDLKLKLISGK
nr:hypothetical protein [Candidatus Dadabacteria bacterium]NIS07249.1 hypothetical protein [Candidatus Dadabacteria bacterium]NIV40956.1 hypothetical protein [Candidatus Dadabacteria bacterium]NIX14388.1 hypothetical protein [Candidatus Dadabacteria bacterium]NIY20906.1 hypothetical protein [Candidatus Dadabacteria bacterium]